MEPMEWMALAGLSSTASAIPQWLTGDKQESQANELSKTLSRPLATTAPGYTEALESATKQSQMSRLPGASGIEGRLDQNTAGQISEIERLSDSPVMAINAASSAYSNQQAKENELGVDSANMSLHNADVLRNEEHVMGEQENRNWDYNEREAYDQKAAAIRALNNASINNKNSFWKNLFGSGANYALAAGMHGNNPVGDINTTGGEKVTPGSEANFVDTRSPLEKHFMWGN